jgi:F-type H+-transporting ATPase subunit b
MFLLIFQEVKLVPDGSLFVHIAIILIMIWVLNRTLFRPINRILAEREARTGGTQGSAAAVLQQVDQKLAAYEKGLRDARGAGYQKMEAVRAEAMAARQTELGAVRDEVGGLVKAEKDSIAQQAAEAKAALLIEAKESASSISARILRRS